MSNIKIGFMGNEVDIKINSYTPEEASITNKLPEDCYEGSAEEIEWSAATNNILLNILLEEDYFDEINELVSEAIYEERESAAEEYAISKYEAERDREYGY